MSLVRSVRSAAEKADHSRRCIGTHRHEHSVGAVGSITDNKASFLKGSHPARQDRRRSDVAEVRQGDCAAGQLCRQKLEQYVPRGIGKEAVPEHTPAFTAHT